MVHILNSLPPTKELRRFEGEPSFLVCDINGKKPGLPSLDTIWNFMQVYWKYGTNVFPFERFRMEIA
jgi:hypothetical protein